MAKILLQTTIVATRRFSLLAGELGAAGHEVTARHRDDSSGDDSVVCLGSLGLVNQFHRRNPQPGCERDDQDNPGISWPDYHSGANGDDQPIFPAVPIHEWLRTAKTASGHIEWFPARPHEGAVSPASLPAAQLLAEGRSAVTGRFNLAVDGEVGSGGPPMGRAVAESTFRRVADYNWDIDRGAPSFVTDAPGSGIKQDPSRLEVFKDYVHNLASWLKAQ